ncbi:MAG: AbrB/MazE/SpoVT family DNA-binding domain-containing protein [Dehalococcoidia bacterium]|nr:AbrB/MazE/SpoVT family DNA-binding domain-containing protein [Dehalococcoidia bacterium]
MAKVRARISSKGQITLPRVVREHLGVGQGSTVEFEVVDGHATIRPVESGFLRHMGTFTAKQPITDWSAAREDVAADVAKRAIQRGRL